MKPKALASNPTSDATGVPEQRHWTDKASFTRFKFAWLRQVASDPNLPPAAAPVAILLADEYLNEETGDCWPSVDTITRQTGRGKTQTRAALQAMDGVHLHVDWTTGGKGKTNRYRPIILLQTLRISGGLRIEGTPGTTASYPPENGDQTLRKSDRKPSGIPVTNPYEGIPLKEPRAGLPKAAPAHVSRSRSTSVLRDDSDASASRASVVYPDGFNVGVGVEVIGEGDVIIGDRVGDLMTGRSITGELITFRRVEGLMCVVTRHRERFEI